MSNVSAPLGFKPMRSNYGYGPSWQVRPYPIVTAYATALYQGDVVKLINTGYINRASAGDQMRGIFVGVSYKDSNNRPVISNYWPASTTTWASGDATALVIDDPNITFEAQFDAAMGAGNLDMGMCYDIVATAGTAATGMSAEQLGYSTASTTAVFRVLGYVQRPDNDTGATAYTRVEVVPAKHDFRVNTGV